MLCVETPHVHNKLSMSFFQFKCTTGPGCLKMNRLAAFTCLAFRTANQEQPPAATPAAAKAWQALQTHDLRNADVDDMSAVAKARVMFASHVEEHENLDLYFLACKM